MAYTPLGQYETRWQDRITTDDRGQDIRTVFLVRTYDDLADLTAVNELEEKEEFYKELEHRCKKIQKTSELLFIGDWNVRFQGRQEEEEELLVKWTVGRGREFLEKCERKTIQATSSELCLDWCRENNLIHQTSQFQKPIDKKSSYRDIGTEPTDK